MTAAGTGGQQLEVVRAVRSYLDHLVVERGLADNTLKSYRRDLRRYAGWLAARGVDGLDAVREETVTEFLVALREGDPEHPPLGAGSAARTVVAVRGFHKFAVREGLSQVDPSAAVRPPAPAKRLPKALPLADIERILEAAGAPGTALAMRDRALLEMLYGTGARISEAVGLDLDDLDLADPADPAAVDQGGVGGTVLLRGKGSKERIVPVGSYAREAVETYLVRGRPELAATGSGLPAVFLNARGGRLSRQSAWAVLAKAAERAGLHVEVGGRARRPGAARSRVGDDHAGLHAGHRRQPA